MLFWESEISCAVEQALIRHKPTWQELARRGTDNYGLWPGLRVCVMPYWGCMGYGMHFSANQLGGPKKVCVIREYALSELCVMRESTVLTYVRTRSTHSGESRHGRTGYAIYMRMSVVNDGIAFCRIRVRKGQVLYKEGGLLLSSTCQCPRWCSHPTPLTPLSLLLVSCPIRYLIQYGEESFLHTTPKMSNRNENTRLSFLLTWQSLQLAWNRNPPDPR